MTLRHQGVKLEPKLRYASDAPITPEQADLLRKHRVEIIAHLATGQEVVQRLPWELTALARAASLRLLTFDMKGIPDVNRYVLARCVAYLVGEQDEALKCLWAVHHAWQPAKVAN